MSAFKLGGGKSFFIVFSPDTFESNFESITFLIEKVLTESLKKVISLSEHHFTN